MKRKMSPIRTIQVKFYSKFLCYVLPWILFLKNFCCPLPLPSLMVQLVKNPPAMWETWVQPLGWEDPLEKGKATLSSILAWRIPGLYRPWGHKESDTTE